MEIGNRIGRLRVQRGWSQEKLGQEAHVKPAQISKIEIGAAVPRITTLMAICRALNCGYEAVLPASPGMQTIIDPQLIELGRALDGLPRFRQDQIIETALAAAKHYKRE